MNEYTKNVDKFLCNAYKEYLERLENDMDTFTAMQFSYETIRSFKPFLNRKESDIKSILAQVQKSNFGTMTMEGNFFANDNFIVYMENRFKNGLSEVLDTISKFIP